MNVEYKKPKWRERKCVSPALEGLVFGASFEKKFASNSYLFFLFPRGRVDGKIG